MSDKNKYAIAQLRVSTKRQAQFGTSLDTQEEEIIKFAKLQGFNIVKLIRETDGNSEGVSGYDLFSRVDLIDSLRFLDENPHIKYFICWKSDRFMRNAGDAFWFLSELERRKVRLISVVEQFDDSIDGEFYRNLSFVFADKDRKETIKKLNTGHVRRYKEGFWSTKVPIGFMKAKVFSKSARPLVPREPQYSILKEGFKLMLSENYNMMEVLKIMNDSGLRTTNGKPLSKQTWSRILKSYIYAGYVRINHVGAKYANYDIPPTKGEFYKYRLIDLKDWYRLQDILKGKRKNMHVKYNLVNENFLLAKSLKCTGCNYTMSGYTRKGKYGYYQCTNPKCTEKQHVSQKKVESAFYDFLDSIKVTEEFRTGYARYLRLMYQTESEEQLILAKTYEKTIQDFEKKIVKVKEMIEADLYTLQEGQKKIDEHKGAIANLNNKLAKCLTNDVDIAEIVEKDLYFLEHFKSYYSRIPAEYRLKITEFLFPDGLRYTGVISNPTEAPALRYIWTFQEDLSHMATLMGHSFEKYFKDFHKYKIWFIEFNNLINKFDYLYE